MTEPKKPRTKAQFERDLDSTRDELEVLEKRIDFLRGKRNAAIVGLLWLPEDERPTATEVAKRAGVSRPYVSRLLDG